MGILYIVATPIGNLEDLTFRALRILKEADLILCEDTRKTKILLDYYEIKTPVLSYHQHSNADKISHIIKMISCGKNLALVSDAGTPGISDPGNLLIKEIILKLGEVKIFAIPGASAVAACASVSGFPMEKFLFLGFVPVKNKKNKFFKEIIKSEYPVIFYESPFRIIRTLEALKALDEKIQVVAGRELTKKFETVYRGKITEVIEKIKQDTVKGEFTVIVKSK
jgi:16S rRNA (cytidine1402-2'-O)-methyltransferase